MYKQQTPDSLPRLKQEKWQISQSKYIRGIMQSNNSYTQKRRQG